MLRTIFMGTPEIAATVLTELISDDNIELIACVTQPDKPKGRGKEMGMSEVKQTAMNHNIPVLQPQRARNEDFINEIRDLKPDLIIVIAFGQILPQELLDIPPYGCLNIHASLLPKYRGAAPIQQVIINGETETGVTIMRMDAGLDTGDMILKEVVPIESDETGGSLHDKLAAAGASAIKTVIKQIIAGTAVYEKQDDRLSCYAAKLTKEMGNLDFNKSSIELERLVRGLNPWPSAYTHLNGKTLKIWQAKAVVTEDFKNAACGEIIALDKTSISIKTGDGILKVTELQLEGKKKMMTGDFLRGYQVEPGTVLS